MPPPFSFVALAGGSGNITVTGGGPRHLDTERMACPARRAERAHLLLRGRWPVHGRGSASHFRHRMRICVAHTANPLRTHGPPYLSVPDGGSHGDFGTLPSIGGVHDRGGNHSDDGRSPLAKFRRSPGGI